jgi:hypothetical protein
MRARAAAVFVVLALVAAFAACSGAEAPASDVCGQAKQRFASCGTSVPLLGEGTCSGTSRIVARCVVDHAHDCEELATLFGRIDACVADMLDGGDSLLPPATDLPVPARDDGGRDAATDAAVDAAPLPNPDAGRPADAATDGAR